MLSLSVTLAVLVGEVHELSFSAMISMVVVMLLVCGGCSALVYFVCRRRRRSSGSVLRAAPPPDVPHQTQPMLPAHQPTYPSKCRLRNCVGGSCPVVRALDQRARGLGFDSPTGIE
jgi:hypothetical protein